MPQRYIYTSEVGSFVSCRRAWFLERRNQPTNLSARPEGGAPGASSQHVARKSLFTARLSMVLLALGTGGIAWLALLASMGP